MTELNEVREVPRPIEAVFDYVADFSTTAEYDPGVSRAERHSDPGPGARFTVDAMFLGQTLPLTYTCTVYERPARLEFQGTSSGSRALDRIRFEPTETGTRIHWNLQLELTGPSRLFEVFLRPALRRLGRKALDGLSERLHDPRALPTSE